MADALTTTTAPEPGDDGLYEVTVRHAIFRYRETIGDAVALRHARRGATIRVALEDLSVGLSNGAFVAPGDDDADEVDHDAERVRLAEVLEGNVDAVLAHARENPDDIEGLYALEAAEAKPRKGVTAGLEALAVEFAGADEDDDDTPTVESLLEDGDEDAILAHATENPADAAAFIEALDADDNADLVEALTEIAATAEDE